MSFWVGVSSAAIFLLYATAVVFAVRAASTARTPQGAVGWVIFLILNPVLAIPSYLFLGHHRFRGYRIARQESERVVEALRLAGAREAPARESTDVCLPPFETVARMPALRGNGADLLIDGQAGFGAIFSAIDAAEDYILAQFYILRDDDLGRAFADRLIAAAKRGVVVRLLTDGVGSLRLPRSYSDRLREAGVRVVDDSQVRGPKFRFQINYRNHRKTVIVDGHTGFTGGLNVGDEYMGRDPGFGPWRDTMVRLSGPLVAQLQLIFVEDWHWLTEETLLDDLAWTPGSDARDMAGLIVATGPGDGSETGSMMFFAAIAEARERFWIATPYFVPDLDIMAALRLAAMRGVDVRILVPDAIDHYMPWLAAFAYFDEMTGSGVKIFRYTEGFMHQKVFVVDDRIGAVGTPNLDNRSFRLNFEAMALFFDARVARAVVEMLEADFARAIPQDKPITAQPWPIRWGAPVARLFSPLL